MRWAKGKLHTTIRSTPLLLLRCPIFPIQSTGNFLLFRILQVNKKSGNFGFYLKVRFTRKNGWTKSVFLVFLVTILILRAFLLFFYIVDFFNRLWSLLTFLFHLDLFYKLYKINIGIYFKQSPSHLKKFYSHFYFLLSSCRTSKSLTSLTQIHEFFFNYHTKCSYAKTDTSTFLWRNIWYTDNFRYYFAQLRYIKLIIQLDITIV